jgi:HK97 family phage major capsid protein
LADDVKALQARAFCGELTYDQFRKEVLSVAQSKRRPEVRVPVGEAGMSQRDIGNYSLRRAILNASENGGRLKNCFEADLAQQAEANSKTRASGFFVPMEVCIGAPRREYMRRDMTVSNFGTGGAFVQTDIMSIVELLRNRLVCVRMGATVLAGLEGNCAFPRETAPATAYSLPEIGIVSDSNPNVDQVALVPHRVSSTVKYSKQLLIQSSIDAEGFVRDDMVKQVAIKQDYLALSGGGGADEPTGILNTPGVGSMTFGGAPTWPTIVNFETTLGLANADQGRLGWAVAPLVRGVWKQTAKLLTGASTVAAVPLWQDLGLPSQEAVDGIVNGYRATSSNQLSGANLVVFGNWTELLLGIFGGLDIIIDPFSLATSAEVRCTVHSFIDVALRHAQSFCISADSGAQ